MINKNNFRQPNESGHTDTLLWNAPCGPLADNTLESCVVWPVVTRLARDGPGGSRRKRIEGARTGSPVLLFRCDHSRCWIGAGYRFTIFTIIYYLQFTIYNN